MEKKRINILFSLVLIFFLGLTYILLRGLNDAKANDYLEYRLNITHVSKIKDMKIEYLKRVLIALQKENVDLKNTLAETKNSIDSISQKMAQPVAAPVVTAADVNAALAPAAAPKQ